MNDSKFDITKSELFRHPQFGNLRVLTDEKGDPWFVGKVVAEALGYLRPGEALSDHVLLADRKILRYKAYAKTAQASEIWRGQDFSDKTIINESGLYSLILGSKLPSAIEFKQWVTSEVLPQIRRTGGYIPTHDAKGNPLTDLEIMSLAFQIHERTIAERDRKIAEQDETIRVLEPKAEYCDEVLESVNCMTMTQVAKEHGTTHPALTKLLHEKGVLFMQSGQWMLYADYGNHGLTRNRTHSYHDSEGVTHSHSYLVWTEKGRMFLDGILRRRLSPKEALRQVEHARQPHVQKVVQLEINL
jgi:prophage antirepressor-like protein